MAARAFTGQITASANEPVRLYGVRLKRREANHVLSQDGPLILGGMLFLCAFAAIIPREPEPNDLLAQSRAVLGHLGLTIIALVFVLLTFWKS
jgi:hypothetical protein